MAKSKKLGKVPWGALVWGSAAGLLAWRTFHNPARAVVADGFASQCAGRANGACSRAMTIDSFIGAGPVYSVVSGRVLQVMAATGGQLIKIAAAHERVILSYSGPLQVQVAEGQEVGIGQQIALAAQVRFSVEQVRRTGRNLVEGTHLEPASWLAARGLRISVKSHGAGAVGPAWCEGGRKLVVPESVAHCGLHLPAPSGWMLLPTSVTMG